MAILIINSVGWLGIYIILMILQNRMKWENKNLNRLQVYLISLKILFKNWMNKIKNKTNLNLKVKNIYEKISILIKIGYRSMIIFSI